MSKSDVSIELNVNELRQSKNYSCRHVSIPTSLEVNRALEIIDTEVSYDEFISEVLEHEISLKQIQNLRESTGLTEEEIIEISVTLLTIVTEHQNQGSRLKISG